MLRVRSCVSPSLAPLLLTASQASAGKTHSASASEGSKSTVGRCFTQYGVPPCTMSEHPVKLQPWSHALRGAFGGLADTVLVPAADTVLVPAAVGSAEAAAAGLATLLALPAPTRMQPECTVRFIPGFPLHPTA